MTNPNQPTKGRIDTTPDPDRVSGQKDKPGIGQPGRGGDDLSGRGTHHDDATRIDDHQSPQHDTADNTSQQARSGQPLSTGEQTLGGNQGAM